MLRTLLFSSVSICMLATPIAAVAQEFGELQEVIVTAQRRSERLQDVPLSVTSQSAEQLRRSSINDTRDLVTIVPGLTMTFNGSWAQPTIRGVTGASSQAGNDPAVPIYIDGIYHPNQQSNSFEFSDIERIEVLKGPQGTLFGRNATGGAILITTLTPTFDFSGNLSVTGGHYDGGGRGDIFTIKGMVNAPIVRDRVAANLSALVTKDTGYLRQITDGTRNARWGEIQATQVRGKILVQVSDAVKVVLTGFNTRRVDHTAQAAHPLNSNTLGRRVDPTTPLPRSPWEVAFTPATPPRTAVLNAGGAVQLDADLGFATLTSRTGYERVRGQVQGDIDLTALPLVPLNLQQTDKPFQQELILASAGDHRLNWVAGAFFYKNHSTFQNYLSGVAGYIDTRAWAVFSEANFALTDRLTATGGVRYSHEKQTQHARNFGPVAVAPFPNKVPFPDVIPLLGEPSSWNSVTPRASIRYEVSEAVNLYATYTRGFKSGAYSISALSPTSVHPETVNSYEVGVKVSSPTVVMSAALFHYGWNDLQVVRQGELNGQPISVLDNAAAAKITGLEFDGTWRVAPSLTLRAMASVLPKAEYTAWPSATVFLMRPDGLGGNLQTAIDASGLRLIRAPKWTGGLTATYTTMVAGGEFEGSVNLYHSEGYKWAVDGQVSAPKYTTLDAQLNWTLPNGDVRFTIWGKNLTNDAYQVAAVPNVLSDLVVYGPPRQFGITAAYEF